MIVCSHQIMGQIESENLDDMYVLNGDDFFCSPPQYYISDVGKMKLDSIFLKINSIDLDEVMVICYHYSQDLKKGSIFSQKKAENVLFYLSEKGLLANNVKALGVSNIDESTSENLNRVEIYFLRVKKNGDVPEELVR